MQLFFYEWITFPYYFIVNFWRLAVYKSEGTLFNRKNQFEKSDAVIAYSRSYMMNDIKKPIDNTFNDVIMTVFSFACHKYFIENGIENKINNLFMYIPVARTHIPRNANEVVLKNQITGVITKVPLITHLFTC